MLVVVVISGIIVAAVGSSFVVSTRAATSSNDRVDRSRDAQQTSTYFLSDAQNASYFSESTVPAPAMGSCSDFGADNVAVFEWTEGTVRKDAIYGLSGSPSELIRRYCEDGTKQYDVTLVRHVGSTIPEVTCPSTPCSANSAYLEMAVTETAGTYESAYSYTVRADPRTTGSGPTGPMGGIAIYVGQGGITTGGSKTTIKVDEGTVTVDGESKCNGDNDTSPAFDVEDGFYPESNTGCQNAGSGTAPSDPLIDLAAPTAPATSTTEPDKKNGYKPPNSTACGTSQPTFQPGLYPKDWALENGCLASGTYYFSTGVVLKNVTSAPGGVHIYIADGGGDFSNVTLSPLTTGDQAGITVFEARGIASAVKTNDDVTINGAIYLPAGELLVQSTSGYLQAGSINVKTLTFGGNSLGVIII
jgi:type II secretory pathway pseudopilin PulG